MVRGQCLSKKNYRQDGAESRHEMNKRSGYVGSEHGYCSVPEDEGQYRGKNRYIENCDDRSCGNYHGPAGGNFQQIEWQQDSQANQYNPHLIGQGMQSFWELLQIGRIKSPEKCGDKNQDITPVKVKPKKGGEFTTGNDQHNAAERYGNTKTLPDAEAIFVHCPGDQHNDDRGAGIYQCRIDCGRSLHGDIDEAVEAGDPDNALDCDKFPVLQDKLTLGKEVAEAETGQNQQSNCPSPE